MNDEIYILDRPTVNIILNKKLELFTVRILQNDEYNSEGFEEFLKYFQNTWKIIRASIDIFSLYVSLETDKDNELPLPAYMSLLRCINEINDILKTNCHCICIFTKDAKKWQDAYNFVTTLWNPKEHRPILFTDDEDDKKVFLHSNKLIR